MYHLINLKTMKRVNFKNSVIALAIGLAVVSCGGRGGNQQSGDTSETKTETKASKGGADWTSNEYTKQLPKPDITVSRAEKGPNGYNVDFEYESATLENLKAYVAKLKAAGFDKDVYEDIDDERYSVTLFNAARWRVVVSNRSGRFMIISKPEEL